MRKLLFLTFVFLSVLNTNIFAQVCGSGAVKRWTGTNQSGDQPGIIPISIDGFATDWRTHIAGPLNPAYNDNTTPQPNPYLSPIAGANLQNDALVNNGDKDVPSSDARDLRFFAFTYDQKNIYFYYRRPSSATTQVYLYYFIDVNADGFMKTGEPVVVLYYTNGKAQITMGRYIEANLSSSSILTAKGTPYETHASTIHVTGKGDLMVAPASFVGKVSGTDYNWTEGNADGYGLPGMVETLTNQPTPNLLNNELFAAQTTEGGFGAEFVIPWSFLKNYTLNTTPLNYSKVFIWHVALENGSANSTYAFEDNAGGCCGGAAVSGSANITPTLPTVLPNGAFTKYKVLVPYNESAGAATDVQLRQITFSNIKSSLNDLVIDPNTFNVSVAPDKDNNGIADVTAINYTYNSSLSSFVPSLTPSEVPLTQNGSGQFIVEVDIIDSRIISVDVGFKATAQIVITNDCETTTDDEKVSLTKIQVTPLPVHFQSFNAARNKEKKEQVILKWTTATEQNNRGFNVQRKVGGQWKNIAYVFSQAENGNSNTALTYEYKDANVSNTVTQYQIQQVDYDGKTSYSDIKAVPGMEQKKSVVTYPNPGVDGKVNLLFSEIGSVKEVIVSDMNGRIVKQYRQVTENNLTIEGLQSGFYTIKITDRTTANTTVEKVIIR